MALFTQCFDLFYAITAPAAFRIQAVASLHFCQPLYFYAAGMLVYGSDGRALCGVGQWVALAIYSNRGRGAGGDFAIND